MTILSTPGSSTARVSPAPPVGTPHRTVWSQVVFLAAILFVASSLRLVLTPLQEAMKIDMHFTDLQVGMMQGVSKGVPIAIISLPIGLAIDHANRARLLLILALCWTGGTLWTAFAHGFLALCCARALVGIGSASALAVALSMIADLCMPAKRGRVMLLAGVGTWAGFAMAFAAGGALYGHFVHAGTGLLPGLAPWRQATLVFGIVGAVMLIPIALFREPVRHEREQKDNAVGPALRAVWARWPFIVPLMIGQMAGGMAEGAAGIWAAPVLTRSFGLQPNQFGGWMGGMILVSGILGSVLGGVIADLGGKSGRRGGVLIGAIVATLLTAPAAVYPIMPTVALFGMALGALLLGCTVAQMIGLTAITVLIPNEERGVCMAVIGMISTLVSLCTAPLVAWIGITLFGDEQHMPNALALLGLVAGVLALIGYIIAMFNAPVRRADA